MPEKKGKHSNKSGVFICLGILAVALLGAGCTGTFSGTNDTIPGTAVHPGNGAPTLPEAGTSGCQEEFSPDHPYPGSCYFATHTPVGFLDDLRTHTRDPVVVISIPPDWITARDIGLLMEKVDSSESAAPVVSPVSSYWPANETSTVGNEALFLIEGYREGRYPPALCSVYYFRPNKTEVRAWWEAYRKQGLLDERTAVSIVQNANTDLRAYPSDVFPTKAIVTQKSPDGWYVAFIVEGSGVPIVSARCYHVGNDRKIRETAYVNHSLMVMPGDFSAEKCG